MILWVASYRIRLFFVLEISKQFLIYSYTYHILIDMYTHQSESPVQCDNERPVLTLSSLLVLLN